MTIGVVQVNQIYAFIPVACIDNEVGVAMLFAHFLTDEVIYRQGCDITAFYLEATACRVGINPRINFCFIDTQQFFID